MRGTVGGLSSPHPLGGLMPAVFQDDNFTMRWTQALDELYRYLSPLPGGGPEGTGWPFGRPVQAGSIFGLLQRVRGVELVEDVRLFSADPVSGSRGKEVSRIDVAAHSLVFSFDHHIRVEEH